MQPLATDLMRTLLHYVMPTTTPRPPEKEFPKSKAFAPFRFGLCNFKQSDANRRTWEYHSLSLMPKANTDTPKSSVNLRVHNPGKFWHNHLRYKYSQTLASPTPLLKEGLTKTGCSGLCHARSGLEYQGWQHRTSLGSLF